MKFTLNQKNKLEVMNMLQDFFSKPFDVHFAWDAPFDSNFILNKKNETSHYEVAILHEVPETLVQEEGPKTSLVISFVKDDDGMLLYEGDVIQLIDNELLIEQKSLAIISILGKKNLVSLVKHVK